MSLGPLILCHIPTSCSSSPWRYSCIGHIQAPLLFNTTLRLMLQATGFRSSPCIATTIAKPHVEPTASLVTCKTDATCPLLLVWDEETPFSCSWVSPRRALTRRGLYDLHSTPVQLTPPVCPSCVACSTTRTGSKLMVLPSVPCRWGQEYTLDVSKVFLQAYSTHLDALDLAREASVETSCCRRKAYAMAAAAALPTNNPAAKISHCGST